MRHWKIARLFLIAGAFWMTNCITLNIALHFEDDVREEARAVESAVRGGLLEEPPPQTPTDGQDAATEPEGETRVWPSWRSIRIAVALGAPAAWAQAGEEPKKGIDVGVKSETQKKLVASRIERATDVSRILSQGHVAEGKDGLLVYSERFESLPERVQEPIKKIAEAENKDRNAFFKESAKVNNVPEEEMDSLRQIFADTYRLYLLAGQHYEDDNGKWVKVTQEMYQKNLKKLKELEEKDKKKQEMGGRRR